MTAYIEDTQSAHSSSPIELYTFTIGATVYRYTSRRVAVVYSANTYTPAIVRRSMLSIPTQEDPAELIVELPTTDAFIVAYGYSTQPKKIAFTLHIYQPTSALAVIAFQGNVESITTQGRTAKIRIPCLFDDAMRTIIPNRQFQANCNHVLFDARCGIVDTAWDRAVTVSSYTGNTIVVSAVDAGTKVYKHGRIKRNTDSEWRLIINQVGTTLTLKYPFRTLAVSDAMTIYQGCDRTVKTCRDKFANVLNFGGHPNIPQINVFKTGLQ